MATYSIAAFTPATTALEVMVDNQCAVDNVSRFAGNQGYAVQVEAQGADFLLKLSK